MKPIHLQTNLELKSLFDQCSAVKTKNGGVGVNVWGCECDGEQCSVCTVFAPMQKTQSFLITLLHRVKLSDLVKAMDICDINVSRLVGSLMKERNCAYCRS